MNDAQHVPIIIVEDDPATRTLLQRQLEHQGYTVSAYNNGREALDGARAMGSGIVLADWSMPEMDGIQLCQALRELFAIRAVGNIYYILLTAHSEKESIIAGLSAGANDYLTKPYHSGELLARISVGERLLLLQGELVRRQTELHRVNAELAALSRKLEEQANTDSLTELPNRRHFFEQLNEHWERDPQADRALSCIMLDVDHFKKVNDTHGHDAGDAVLRTVGGRLRQLLRRNDFCGRFGGEEFVVACPLANVEDAFAIAERIRVGVATLPIKAEAIEIPVTVSCGVAERQVVHARPEQLLGDADRMLYEAKRSGRNRVCVANASIVLPM